MRASAFVPLLLSLAGICTALDSRNCEAQVASPSQVTPQSLRPNNSISSTSIQLSEQASLVAPSGSEKLNVLIGQVIVEGAFDELADAVEPYLTRLRGNRLSVAEVYSIANAMEKAYREYGFILVRVSIPPQQLIDNGRLVIAITDGFIEQVDASALDENVRALVLSRTNFLVGRRHVRLSEIERCLLIAADTPGLKLKSTLARGDANGGAKLVLDGYYDMLVVSAGTDNRQSASLGSWQLRGSFALNSTLGFGEQIYGTITSSAVLPAALEENSPLRIVGGGVVVPLGDRGLSINPEVTHSVTQTKAQPGIPATVGTFDRLAFRIKSPLIWTRSETLNVTGGIEYIQQNLVVPQFGMKLYADEYGAMRIGADYATSLKWGANAQVAGSASFGLAGRSAGDAVLSGIPLSRIGASSEFTKLNANARYTQPFADVLRMDLIAAGQFSLNKAMLRSEQFSLDGPDALSAFSAGTFSVDQGATLRTEVSRIFAIQFDGKQVAVLPYVFGSVGRGWLVNVTAVEQSLINAGSAGVGIRTSVDNKGTFSSFNLGLELARQFSDVPGLERGWRGNVNAAVTF